MKINKDEEETQYKNSEFLLTKQKNYTEGKLQCIGKMQQIGGVDE